MIATVVVGVDRHAGVGGVVRRAWWHRCRTLFALNAVKLSAGSAQLSTERGCLSTFDFENSLRKKVCLIIGGDALEG